jgi:acyl-CoA reductase-like NAD-dependent aldehyde dehydrogenase
MMSAADESVSENVMSGMPAPRGEQIGQAYESLHFIGGEEVPSFSGRTFESVNPATAERLGVVAFGDARDVDRAVRAGWQAYESGAWSNAAPAARAGCLRRIADGVRERADEIAQLESLDCGKPIVFAREDVESAAALLEYAATLPENVRGQVFAQPAGYLSYSQRAPYGVVGAIAPWNFPFLLAVLKTAPALAVGNSVVLKMAEQTPHSASLYARICADAGLPAGVLNVVHGDGPTTGAALAAHPRVPKITFTGSTAVGREILRIGAETIKSCHLELGGKSPNVVLADANIEHAIAGSLFTSFFNSGQVCTAGSRLLVHESIADEVTSALIDSAQRLVVGDPQCKNTQLGPLVSREQLERVNAYVAAGCESGAEAHVADARGRLPSHLEHGFFRAPTIFTEVDPSMAIAQEEIFGPILAVLRFRDFDEAVAIANDVMYGLAATVWTNRLDSAVRFAERVEAGVIWTNWPHGGGFHCPEAAQKQSGMGDDLGLESISTFTRLKVNHINAAAAPPQW